MEKTERKKEFQCFVPFSYNIEIIHGAIFALIIHCDEL